MGRNVQVHADGADPRDVKVILDSGEVIEGIFYMRVTSEPNTLTEVEIELRPQTVRVEGQLVVTASCPNCSAFPEAHRCKDNGEW